MRYPALREEIGRAQQRRVGAFAVRADDDPLAGSCLVERRNQGEQRLGGTGAADRGNNE